jgi:excisionase family DNA binding protein
MYQTLDVREAAKVVGVTVPCLRRWIVEGRGPRYYRAGRLIRYRLVDITLWIEQNLVETESRPGKGSAR